MYEKMEAVQTVSPPQTNGEGRVIDEVVRKLDASGRFHRGRLEVSTVNGTVKLRGRVDTYYQKQLAQVAAMTVIGPRRLVNEIEVR